jgi:hypothetical protein
MPLVFCKNVSVYPMYKLVKAAVCLFIGNCLLYAIKSQKKSKAGGFKKRD